MKCFSLSLLLLAGFFWVLILPLCFAAEEELAYEPNTTMNIIIKCFDTDSKLCTTSTNCYIDIFYPNMTNFVYNQTMTANGTFFNYTAPATEILGVYHASTNCNDGTTAGYSTFDFYVGRPSTDPQIKTTILSIVVLMGIASLFFVAFLFIRKPNLKWTFFILSILFLIITVNVSSIALRNEAGSENIRNVFDMIGAVSYYMYWFCFGLIAIIWMFGILASIGDKWKMRKARQIGQPIDLEKY